MPTIDLNGTVQRINITSLVEYWIDSHQDTTPDQVAQKFLTSPEIFQHQHTHDVHHIEGKVLWLRFEANLIDPRSHWMLELESPLVDEAQLYWLNANNEWMSLSAGDAIPRSQWPLQTRLPNFTLPSDKLGHTQYFLRIKNTRFPVSLPISIAREQTFISAHQIELMLMGGLIGLIILMIVTSSVAAYARCEMIFVIYGIYTAIMGLFTLTNLGVTPLYLWNNSPVVSDRINYVLAAIAAGAGPLLVRLIIQPGFRHQVMDRILVIQALILSVIVALESFAPSMWSYRLLNVLSMFAVILVYVMVAMAWQRGERITRWIAISFAPVALSALPLVLRNFGLLNNGWLTSYGVPLAIAIEMPMLLYGLFERSSMKRESIARASGLPKQDALTGLPNSRIFIEHLHGCMTRAERFKHQYGLILVELSNHAWFIKEHGREMADRALIIASTRLQQLTRDVDTVCRLDDNVFIILIEGQSDARAMTKISARIAASAHQPADILPIGAGLKFTITSTLVPNIHCQEVAEDPNAKVGWLLAEAEALSREDSRKSMRTIGF